MAMAYILFVNAGMFATLPEVSYEGMYIATAISACIGSLLIGLIANLPLAQASGMGLNAYFVYSVCLGLGFTYSNALVMVLFDGIVFVILTATGLRKLLFNAIPKAVKNSISAGIGLFIAYIGLQSAGIIVPDASTASTMSSFNIFTGAANWSTIMPMLVTLITVLVIAALVSFQKRGAVLIGILVGSVLYYLGGCTIPGFYEGFSLSSVSAGSAFSAFGKESLFAVFRSGFDFNPYISAHGEANFVLTLVTTMIAFCIVDMFDTMGTLYGACSRGGLMTEDGEVIALDKAMLSDALATCVGAACGTSTVTTFVESSAGVAEGGRTGLAALTTAGLFFIAMFFAPVASLVPGAATAAALIYVGALMLMTLRNIDWDDVEIAIPAFLTVTVMAFSYSISNGIGIGVIAYTLIKMFTGKIKEISGATWVIDILFLAMFLLSH
ncbi:MAG: NCS2 family permease [Alphaproteobacteria bacterium]|nr:NCS2 family permease [Alphaproteobacteria bacterium]